MYFYLFITRAVCQIHLSRQRFRLSLRLMTQDKNDNFMAIWVSPTGVAANSSSIYPPPTLSQSYLARYLFAKRTCWRASRFTPLNPLPSRVHVRKMRRPGTWRRPLQRARVVPSGKWINLFALWLIHLNRFRLNYFLSDVVRLSPRFAALPRFFTTRTAHIPTS